MTSDNPLLDYAEMELKTAGLLDEDGDYGGFIGESVLELVDVLSKQGHSGGSHFMVLQVFNLVANYKPLTDITNNPEEWMLIDNGIATESEPLWQSRRNPTLFSHDEGDTFYDLDEPLQGNGAPTIITAKEYQSA